jgi:hypothetical protein
MYYAAFRSKVEENLEWLRFVSRRRPLCTCINDDLGRDLIESKLVESVAHLHQALEVLVPIPGSWEKRPIVTLTPFDAGVFLNNQGVELFVKGLVALPSFVFAAGMILAGTIRLWKAVW